MSILYRYIVLDPWNGHGDSVYGGHSWDGGKRKRKRTFSSAPPAAETSVVLLQWLTSRTLPALIPPLSAESRDGMPVRRRVVVAAVVVVR
jgi:hypothetical protein